MKNIPGFESFVAILFGVSIFCVGTASHAQTLLPLPPPVYPPAALRASQQSHLQKQKQAATPQQEQATQYDCGDPTNGEQYYLELLNRARMNPPAEGQIIAATTDPDVSFEFTYWAGQDANEPTRASIKKDFATYSPKQPLAMNRSLLIAARAHSQDMLDHNYQGHTGTDGSSPGQRAQTAGYQSPYVGENAAAYAVSVFEAHCGWLIDFGVPNDTQWGHRNNCLEFKTGSEAVSYTEMGVGMIPGGGVYPNVGPLVSTLDLGDDQKHFVLGVVYNDLNRNGFYDPGEGVSGVRIDVQGASYYAISSTSGGYAIPYSGGNTKVTASLHGGAQSQTITFNGENVKVDFVVNGLPGEVTLLSPSIDTTVNSSSATFRWAMDTGATTYHLQVGVDTAMTKAKLIVNDSTITTLSKAVTVLKDTTTYYWRVRAKNSKGWGPFSPVQSFAVVLPPNKVVAVSPASGATIPGDADVTFTWQATTPRVSNYWLQVSKNATMAPPFVVSDTLDASALSDLATASHFQGNTTYYWQVLAQNDGGWSAPSTMRVFTTSASGVAGENGSSTAVSIVPNPARDLANFHITMASAANVSLRLFNSLGEEVKLLVLGRFAQGGLIVHVDCSDLATGSYRYQLMIGDHAETGQLVLVR